MDFEGARHFADRQRELQIDIYCRQPKSNLPEYLTTAEKFDLYWDAVEALIHSAPPGGTYRVDENTVRTEEVNGLRLTISRELNSEKMAGREVREIHARWELDGHDFIHETISEIDGQFTDWTEDEERQRYGEIGDSIRAAEKLTQDLVNRMQSFDTAHHGIPGHP